MCLFGGALLVTVAKSLKEAIDVFVWCRSPCYCCQVLEGGYRRVCLVELSLPLLSSSCRRL